MPALGEFLLGSAYTPGLTVSGDIVVRRTRRLPIKGEVLVKVGDAVGPTDVVARAMLPGVLQTIKLAEALGIEPKDTATFFQAKVGDYVTKGQLVAETKGFLGWFKNHVNSKVEGTVESISDVTGSVLVREAPIPVDLPAYMRGKIAEVIPEEGAIVETRGAMVQGIFGVGGERHGVARVAAPSPDKPMLPEHILDSDGGKILAGGSSITVEAIRRAVAVGALGLVVGGIRDSDLIEFLGYDIGVAITGSEHIDLTLVVTEGFGNLAMAERTYNLLKTVEGKEASMNGATQIRAGVIRPEVIVPLELGAQSTHVAASGGELTTGTPIRIIREPYFGAIGEVTALPATLQRLESGTEVRVLMARLQNGDEVCVPRANVEIIAS